jgi:hypothetical protein
MDRDIVIVNAPTTTVLPPGSKNGERPQWLRLPANHITLFAAWAGKLHDA